MAARRVWVQVAANEMQLFHTAFEFADAVGRRNARRLRQPADTDKVVGIQRASPANQIVANLRPLEACGCVPDLMAHADCAGRKDREIGAAFPLEFQLRVFETFPNLIVGDLGRFGRRRVRLILEAADLPLSIGF